MDIELDKHLSVFLSSVILGAVIKAAISFPDTWDIAKKVFSEIRKFFNGFHN
jgi:hypothetical protein